ncbi:DUF2933 domain-containing protein [Mycetocola manganoxydans]|uniref:DUF2933 domain-containing protein n=1 Tax=Mycetocola manganoxydans TaxID=699879 RepID=A0A3L6ZUP8_9MICO|nr:DUF2933 domain-containing protein [Mycetocola manganoxydans]RLP71385.1 DUF2933 domain-containing protein [Mycetocola manganoxydans]GHD46160.1 hypothetical protein GCM10008097_15860 [Mycetocola manganoxydans]
MSIELPHHDHSSAEPEQPREPADRAARVPASMWIILALAVAGIAVYLMVDHWPHVLAAVPYLGIVAVVAMHVFGHGGHGGSGGTGTHGNHGGRSKPGAAGGPATRQK